MSISADELEPDAGSARLSRADLLFFTFASVFIYLQLFELPFTPIYFEGDHMLHLANAMRLLDGEIMYRDFFHFTPPSTEIYYAALFSAFGVKIWILNATILLLGVAQLFLILFLSKQFVTGALAWLPAAIYFAVGFRPFGIDGSNRLFSIVFVLAAAALLIRRRSPKYLAMAGGLCGIASFFVHTRGFLGVVALALFLLWDEWRNGLDLRRLIKNWLWIGMPFLLVVTTTQFYFAMLAGFDNYYFATVTFIKDHYGGDTLSNTLAYFSDIPNLQSYFESYGTLGGMFRYIRVAIPTIFFYSLIPLVYLIYLLFRLRHSIGREIKESDSGLMLLCILGLTLFAGASAPTGLRLYHISVPGLIIFVWLLSQFRKTQNVAFVGLVLLCFLGVAYAIQRQTVEKSYVQMPTGTAAFLSQGTAEKYEWLASETTPGESLYEAQHPSFYFPLHLKNPTPYYLIRDNGYTPDFQVKRLVDSLESRPPRLIIWQGVWSKEPQDRKPGDSLEPLWQFIKTRYKLKKEFHDQGEFTLNSYREIEIWEKLN